jgi:hypothetical protein
MSDTPTGSISFTHRGNMKRFLIAAGLTTTMVATMAHSQDSIVVSRPTVTIFHEFGNLIRGSDYGIPFENYFVQRSGAWINLKAARNERLMLNATIGGTYWNPTYNNATGAEGTLRYFAAAVPRASITYNAMGEPSKPTLSFETGIFPYKYNDYTHNLGEYMFRSVAYPSQVYTGGLTSVDVNRATVSGAKISHRIGNVFSHDLLLTLETDQLPYYDLNLTYMAKADVGSMLKFRAGAQFARILPVKPSVTNPDIPFNRYFSFNDTNYISNSEYYTQRLLAGSGDSAKMERGEDLAIELKGYMDNGKTMAEALDTMEQIYGVAPNSSSYDHYDATSIKTVVAFSFDPKPLLPVLGEFLGSNDLVLYGEAAILGLKNYPVLYEDRMERTVAMLGVNLPTFRQLDVLAFEMEWFGSRYPNSNELAQTSLSKDARGNFLPMPQPTINGDFLRETTGYSPDDWKRDDIKWSVFARRQLVKGFFLDAQIASDNARGFTYPAGRRYWAMFDKPSDWYWMMKLSASI